MGGVSPAGSASEAKAVWLWALVGSLAVHLVFLSLALSWKGPLPPPERRVVPVEAVTLTKVRPEPAGGGGQPEPALQPLPQPKTPPKPKPRIKKAEKKPEKAAAPEIPPPPALSLPKPVPPSGPAASGRPTASLGRSSGPGGGQGGGGGGVGGGSGPGVGPGQGTGTGTGSLLQGYLREVRRLLERQKEYPRMAQRLNMQGVAVLRFTIGADGGIRGAGLARSSGHDLLDAAARDTVSKVGRFPPLPAALGREKLTIEIPLAFRLTNN